MFFVGLSLLRRVENDFCCFFSPQEFSHRDLLDAWQQEDNFFVPTKASEQVENKTTQQNLVIVVGRSGSGKSAIIHHIALKYREKIGL